MRWALEHVHNRIGKVMEQGCGPKSGPGNIAYLKVLLQSNIYALVASSSFIIVPQPKLTPEVADVDASVAAAAAGSRRRGAELGPPPGRGRVGAGLAPAPSSGTVRAARRSAHGLSLFCAWFLA